MNRLHILIVNINNLNYTKQCLDSLNKQTQPFDLTIVDNGSVEKGTLEFFNSLSGLTMICNNHNKPLNHIWNEFVENNENEFMYLLNNDTILPKHLIEQIVSVFDKEPSVGIVIQATNHPSFNKSSKELKYEIPTRLIKQGWAFCVRKKNWIHIPDILKFYCGDDFIFQKNWDNGFKTAVLLSSPIIHFQGKSTAYCDPKYVKGADYQEYVKLGVEKEHIWHPPEYSFVKPRITEILEDDNN